jgi:enoyl-CoA hydratase
MAERRFVTYEQLDGGSIVRIMLNRPEARNAQNRGMLVELNDAFLDAEADDRVRVVILGGVGKMFSAGHDMGSEVARAEWAPGPDQHPTVSVNGGTRLGAEKLMLQEWHYFFENTRRWRNLRKITIAQVHGGVYAAGLMLMWACDLIVAADTTTFADVVGQRLGMCGVEYFAHPWELGPRRAKELMLTGDSIDVGEAQRIGMVSKIFPEAELTEQTLMFARRIARLPSVTALLIKESVNQTVDNMGFYNALQACFTLHELNHAHWAEVHEDGYPVGRVEDGLDGWRTAPPVQPAVKNAVGGGGVPSSQARPRRR